MRYDRDLSDSQKRLIAEVRRVWGAFPIPEWAPPESEPNGYEPEDVEISRYLAGKSYEAAANFCCSESVFIWCRPDVAAYYLGGYLLNGIGGLSNPNYSIDYHIDDLHSVLAIDSLYREVYRHILDIAPSLIPLVGRYGELLLQHHQEEPPPYWIRDVPWPTEPELIERIRTLWRDQGALRNAVEALP